LRNTNQDSTTGIVCSVPTCLHISHPQLTPFEVSAMSKSQAASDRELLELYAEEMFIDHEYLVQDDVDPQHHTAATICDKGPSLRSITDQCGSSQPVVIPVPVHNEQQACTLYPAQSTTLLFDFDEFTGSDDEPALDSTFCPEAVSAPFEQPVTQDWVDLPGLDLYERSLLYLQLTSASDRCYDADNQMLDYGHNNSDRVQEAAFEYMPIRQGYSSTHPSAVCSDVKLDELAKLREREHTFFLSDDVVYDPSEADYERVLRKITRNNFLPGVEHISNVEARTAFLAYDNDIHALQHATAEFLADSFECSFLGNKVCAAAQPGENFFLAANNSGVGLSVQYSTAESLLSLIDQVVDVEPLVEELTDSSNFQYEQSAHRIQTSPGTFFDSSSSHFIGYTALDQLLSPSNDVSYVVCAQSDAADNVSDTSDEVLEVAIAQATNILDEEADESSITLPSGLSYFDADTQRCIAYTAFNQLLMELDNDETLPRIHRSSDDLCVDDFTASGDILEIGALSDSDTVDGLDIAVVDSNGLAGFDFDLDLVGVQNQLNPVMVSSALPRPVKTLRSYSSTGRRSRSRPLLVVNTHLTDVIECLSSESKASSGASSSDESIDFADQRGFVQPLSARSSDFLDDEDSEDDDGISKSTTLPEPSAPSSPSSAISTSASPNVEVACELFKNTVWHYNPIIELTFPLTPTAPYSPAANAFPDLEILEAIETELLGLMQYMFQCMNAGRPAELQALESDLHWALSAIADLFPTLSMFKHLGTAVEILLESIVGSGNN
jgi:hypothetical protein